MYSISRRLSSKHWQDKVAVFFFVVTTISLITMLAVPFLYFSIYNADEKYGTTQFWFYFIATFLFLIRNLHVLSDFRSSKSIHIGELNYSVNNINPAKTTLIGSLMSYFFHDFEQMFPIALIVSTCLVFVLSVVINISTVSLGEFLSFILYNGFLVLINGIFFRIVNTVVVREEDLILLEKSNDVTDEEAEKVKKKLKKVIRIEGYVTRLDIIGLYHSVFDNDEFKNRKKKAENISKYSNYLNR